MNIHFVLFSTYLGKPIPYDVNVTPEVLAQRVIFFDFPKKKKQTN